MDQKLFERLNQIPEKIQSGEFLSGHGLGNEISFWIFDYPPEEELEVRSYLDFLKTDLTKKHSEIKFTHINLLDSLVEYLNDRNFISKAIEMQKIKGDEGLLKALKGPLHMDKFGPYLIDKYSAPDKDLIIISGVGSVWPLLRAHNLLNSLHALIGHKPVILFYPGYYTGQSMSLFGKIPSDNYYRAFKLIP